ncbi:MAG TPA: helix-turn-helix domain-containing protein [Ilumatobacter sp.]|nr:helix-turn-helix domain-containing protein [Ilumatobacter sp.]
MPADPQRVPAATAGTTRDLLLDWGERMFAERGIHGVSMREIGLAANQRNNGVTQYHFGDKSGLIRAIFERRAATVNRRRLELLEEHSRNGRDDVGALIDAYVTPLAEQVTVGTWYVPFLSRLQAEHQRDELLARQNDTVNTAYDAVRNRLKNEHLSGLSTEQFAIRWRIALNLVIDALADYQTNGAGDRRRPSLDVFRAELVGAVTAILTRDAVGQSAEAAG